MKNVKTLLNLFTSFFKIGITTFGGGVMMLANLKKELVEKRGWLSEEEMYDYIAIAQVTPGVIMVNSATLIGAKKAGLAGSVVSTVAVVLPSIIIITLIGFLLGFLDVIKPVFAKFLIGVRVAVCATSIRVIYNMIRTNIIDLFTTLIFIAAFCASFFLNLPAAILVLFGIICGILIKHFNKKDAGDVDAN